MVDDRFVIERTACLQVAGDVAVGVLHVLSGEVAHFLREDASHRYRTGEGVDSGRAQHAVVVLAERRRLMHEARAFVGSHVVVHHHAKGAAFAFALEIVEQGFVGAAFEPASLQALDDGEIRVRGAVVFQPCLGQV